MLFASRNTASARGFALTLTALILVAVNLRLAVTSVSALLTALTDSGALTPFAAVLVPALPTAVFAVAGIGTSRISARLGVERTVLIGMIVLTAGLLLRSIAIPSVVVAGTVLATAGLAVVNILLPAVVRAHFGRRIGSVTTAYTTAMALGSALAAAVAVPVANALGSPTLGLAAWAFPALLALVFWALVVPGAVAPAPESGAPAPSAPVRRATGRLPAGTGLLAGYFALQALFSYGVMGWLPTIAQEAGIPAGRSGMLLGIAMAVGIPATALVVPLSRGTRSMRIGFVLVALSSTAGLIGLLVAPAASPELWAALIGIGMCAFPLVLALLAGFGEDAAASARVSTVVQSLGYSIATIGPLGAGALRHASGSWSLVLALFTVGVLLQGAIGVILTRIIAPRPRP